MAVLVTAIHDSGPTGRRKTWIPGTSPGMTTFSHFLPPGYPASTIHSSTIRLVRAPLSPMAMPAKVPANSLT